MANLIDWLEDAIKEGILAVRIEGIDKLLTWEEAKPILDKQFYSGYGLANCPAIYAWTATRIYFISQYDGSTNLEDIPRNPTNEEPAMPGG